MRVSDHDPLRQRKTLTPPPKTEEGYDFFPSPVFGSVIWRDSAKSRWWPQAGGARDSSRQSPQNDGGRPAIASRKRSGATAESGVALPTVGSSEMPSTGSNASAAGLKA